MIKWPLRNITGAELKRILREYPIELRAARPSMPLRPGHPHFVGPTQPAKLNRPGVIQYDEHGNAFIVL